MAAHIIPSGNYPKAVCINIGTRTVPAVWPAGDAKQFTLVILNTPAEEAAYASTGVPITTTHGATTDSWAGGQMNKGPGGGGSGNR